MCVCVCVCVWGGGGGDGEVTICIFTKITYQSVFLYFHPCKMHPKNYASVEIYLYSFGQIVSQQIESVISI